VESMISPEFLSAVKTTAIIWVSFLSVLSVILTVCDKLSSKKRRGARVPEAALFLAAVLGGSAAMYITMLVMRHKTNHKRFMIGLPVIIVAQYGILMYCIRFAG